MKKITTLVAMACVSSFAFAQSQRLVLHEEFTQASCGPCAAANPYYNALVNANTNKLVSIKFQSSWPGVDPMNAQDATELNYVTSTYYGVNGVPDGKQDGVDFYPGNISQGTIDAEYGVPSPFTITCTHMYNTAMDSVFVNATVTCTQNVTMTTPKFYMAMIERQISFSTPPGTNGEKDFYNVVRKMIPGQTGTTIAASWTNAQSQNFSFSIKIPTYIYNKGELAFVCWIQDDANKNVYQAGRSLPVPTANDAGITGITGITPASCSTTFTPTVTIMNFGSSTLTSCTINYKIDNNTVQTLPWVGSLAPNTSTTQILPVQTTTAGGHTFTAYTTAPNAATDYDGVNDKTSQNFLVITTNTAAYPMMEPFTNSTYPPTNWALSNPNPLWSRTGTVGGFGQTPLGCSKADFYNITAGNNADLYAVPVNMSSVTGASYLTFDVAYAPYVDPNGELDDTLKVMVSTDCGVTWTQVYSKYGTTLSTAPGVSTSFTPTASQWRKETVVMTNYNGQSSVIVKFKACSNYGNELYLDNVNISSTSSVHDITNNVSLNIFPNPMNTSSTLTLTLAENANVNVTMVNMLGETVQTINAGTLSAGSHDIALDASKLPAGVYFVKVTAGAYTVSKKVVVEK
ncbi:MAG TPA: T9SS type A sorting domain-containing protein [Bacteroidia bacterium]